MELGVSDFLKDLMAGPGRSLLFALWLLAGVVSASAQTSAPTPTATATVTAAPDPITFGYAVERGDLRTVTRWLDEGLNPDYEAAQVGTGLMVAAWYGRVEMMALFVERGADLRRSNRNGEQALQLAAWEDTSKPSGGCSSTARRSSGRVTTGGRCTTRCSTVTRNSPRS